MLWEHLYPQRQKHIDRAIKIVPRAERNRKKQMVEICGFVQLKSMLFK